MRGESSWRFGLLIVKSKRLTVELGAVQDDFAAQFAALGDSYAFVGVDPRGYGLSRPPRRDFPAKYFERDADDVVRVLDQLGYDQVCVCVCGRCVLVQYVGLLTWQQVALLGWSAGANTSAVLAGKYPDRVSRLVLVAGNVSSGCVLALELI